MIHSRDVQFNDQSSHEAEETSPMSNSRSDPVTLGNEFSESECEEIPRNETIDSPLEPPSVTGPGTQSIN